MPSFGARRAGSVGTKCCWLAAWLVAALFVAAGCATAPTPNASSPDAVNSVDDVARPASQSSPRCERAPRPDPLVTEWPASEKAHLQSLFASQPVAVRYDGCELQIIDECRLAGAYQWTAVPTAPSTLRIASKAELEAELPIGGFRLEGELQRSGSLDLETTSSGRYALDTAQLRAPDLGPCTRATHVVKAITVGSFKLLGSGRARGRTEIDLGVRVGSEHQREEDLLRQAGLAETCEQGTEAGPAIQCASPLRLELSPLLVEEPKDALERARKTGAVLVQLRAAEGASGGWSLHDPEGLAVCPLPCTRWLRPASGYSVRHLGALGRRESIVLDSGFPVAPGEQALGIVHPERGAPSTARIVFWGVGAPALVFGGLLVVGGGISWLSSSESGPGMFGVGLGLSAAGGGLYLWHDYSHEGYFELKPGSASSKPVRQSSGMAVGPLYLRGWF
jgi:hypothetical protein